jgi:hypothetical protein
MWLKSLKIALVEQNVEQLEYLATNLPVFETKQDIYQAITLFQEAIATLEGLRDKTSLSMRQIKKNIDFLRSTEVQKLNKLDIKS